MKKPLISVVLTTYNRAKKYLPRAIESVLKQTFKDFELIIVDDCSSDNTQDVVSKYKDKRIKYYRLKKNFGCDTRPKNIGIKRSNADMIAFLDDDNAFRVDHLQALYNQLTKHEELVMVYGDRWVHFEDKKDGDDQIGIYNDFDYAFLMKRNYIDTSDVLVKKKALYEVGGWDENLKKFVDWNLWVRMAKRGYEFKRVPIILTDYTIHKKMKSQTVKEGRLNPETGLFEPTFDPFNCEINAGFIGKKKPFKVAVFTLTKNRLELTKVMAKSMFKTADYDFDWYVVDNGSTDGTKAWLKKQDNIKKIIWNKKNMGIPYSSNQVIKEIQKGDYDFICKIDNDILFKTYGWLRAMMEIYEVFRPIGLSPYIEGLIKNAGGVHRENYLFLGKEFLGLVPHIGGAVSMMPGEVYEKFKWPKVAFLHGGNDVILSAWLNKNQYIMAYMENHRVEHMESTTGQEEKYPEYFKLRKKESVTRTNEFLKTKKLRKKRERLYKVGYPEEPK